MRVCSLSISSGTLKYAVFGSGKKPLVMIPGLSLKSVLLSAQSVANAYSMFAADYTVYLFDRREELSEGVTVGDFVDDIADAMQQLGITGAYVFGTSQGGMIAQLLAIRYPHLVSKLVLGSSAARLHEGARVATENWCRLAQAGDAATLCRDFIQKVYSADFAAKYGDILVRMMSDCTDEELQRFVLCTQASSGFDITSHLPAMRCPVLVLGAEHDAVLTGEASREIADILHCAVYMYGAPYGHAVYDEAPDYKQRLFDFFSKEGD